MDPLAPDDALKEHYNFGKILEHFGGVSMPTEDYLNFRNYHRLVH